MILKIHKTSAEIVRGSLVPNLFDRWSVTISIKFLDADEEISKNHNKMMTKSSRFFSYLMKNEIGVICEMKTVKPEYWRFLAEKENIWIAQFDVLFKDNNDEELAYM